MAQVTGLNEILRNLDGFIGGQEKRAEKAMAVVCEALAGWAKSEHPYTDRTSNNTNSIKGTAVVISPTLVRGVLSASRDYSIYLELGPHAKDASSGDSQLWELAKNGKWAFLVPVIERHKPEILAILSQQMGGQVSQL